MDNNGVEQKIDQIVWNPTVANLTLMALGSSAPEIILNVIETGMYLGKEPQELGPSTIVGSAAFNLLIITAVSIVSVDEPKEIEDVNVFIVTAVFSVWAYIWMFICLQVWTPDEITIEEAILTLLFCGLLIICAYGMDRYRKKQKAIVESSLDVEELEKDKMRMIAKAALRRAAEEKGKSYVIECVNGPVHAIRASNEEREEIRKNFRLALDLPSLEGVDSNLLIQALDHENVLERIAFRKQTGVGARKDFVKIKGKRSQIEESHHANAALNAKVGFKSSKYSVTESSQYVEISIRKKVDQDLVFWVKTIDDTATAPEDYESFFSMIQMGRKTEEKIIKIKVHDDEIWEPDKDFHVILCTEEG